MSFELYLVSKLCSAIIHIAQTGIKANGKQNIEDVLNEIYKLSKKLEIPDYQLYWRYSTDKYFPLSNYFSYSTAVTLSGERKIYMLMNDYGEIWEDNISFLEYLDAQELAEKREKERDIYDVRIPGKTTEPTDSPANETSCSVSAADRTLQLVPEPRTDFDILKYSLRNFPEPKYLQNDLRFKSNFIDDLKLGYSKRKMTVPIEEDILFRIIAGRSKEKNIGSKKSSKSKSSKKKKTSAKGKKSHK